MFNFGFEIFAFGLYKCLLLAIMANNRHLYAPNAKVEKPKLNINISKYSNTGTNSQIIK